MRSKIIVLSIAGVVCLLMVMLCLMSLPKDDDDVGRTEIKLRTDIKDGYTMDDMLSNLPDRTRRIYGSPSSSRNVDEEDAGSSEARDLARIQALIQANEESISSSIASPSLGESVPVPAVSSRNVRKSDTLEKISSVVAEEPEPEKKRRGFNSISLVRKDETNAIKAFVHSTQTVMVGSTLKMQLAENCLTDDGRRVRKGTPVYGQVTGIDGERVNVKITTINIDNNILPFKKCVYSKDAIEGIYVPGNPKSEAAQEAGSAAVQGSNANITGGFDLGTQLVAGAANSVINATKSATSKNIRKIKVTIKTNYQLLLMEDKKGE